MLLLQLLCLAIVAIHLSVATLRAPRPAVYLRHAALVAAASWVAEDTCIRLYGFYAYAPQWSPYLDRMPVMVALIWPGVVLSAWELAGLLLGADHRLVPLASAAMVLADASFMEPIAVQAGLWTWYAPGFFGVPPVGVLGWSLFTFTCVTFLRRSAGRPGSAWRELLLVPLAPALLHPALLAAWWGGLRWISAPIPDWGPPALAWALGSALAWRALRTGAARRVPIGAMATRIPAAAFFFTLLGMYARDRPALLVYALAFAPPYFALTRLRRVQH